MFTSLAIACTACATLSCPVAAWWMFVCTAALNWTYHGGAPFGNGGCACVLMMDSSCDAWLGFPWVVSRLKLDSLAGSGKR